MPNAKAGVSKKNTFNNLCNAFAAACTDASMSDDSEDLTNDLLELLQSTTANYQGMNESDIAAVKVVNLILPAMNFIASRSVRQNLAPQEQKLNRMCAGIRHNTYEIDRQNQYSRRENVRIIGVQETNDENVTDIVLNMMKSLKVDVDHNDIAACHRIGENRGSGKPRPIIIRFVNREKKYQLFRRKKELKDHSEFSKVYIHEDLTMMRLKLYHYVKNLPTVKSVTTRDGKIVCFLKSGKKTMLENPDDLFKIGETEIDHKLFGLLDLEDIGQGNHA